MTQRVWVVGKTTPGGAWEFCGVFDAPEKAEAACTTAYHFIGPTTLNRRLSDKRRTWPRTWRPIKP